MKHIGTLAGASVGALIGGTVWTGVAWLTGYELGILAVGLGIACGIGAALGAKGLAGTGGGVIAALTAMIAIVVSRGIIVHISINQYVSQAIADSGSEIPGAEDGEFWTAFIADQIMEREGHSGQSWQEVDENEVYNDDSYASQYPPEVWSQAMSHWNSFSTSQKQEFCVAGKKLLMKQTAEGVESFRGIAGIIGMLWMNFHPISLVLMGIACFGAFRVAKNSRPANEGAEMATMEGFQTDMPAGQPSMAQPVNPPVSQTQGSTSHSTFAPRPSQPGQPGQTTQAKTSTSDEPWTPPWMRKQG